MANENKDVLRVFDSEENLSSVVRNRQIGFATNSPYKMLRKDSVGNQAWYTSDTGNREQAGTITAASTSGPQFVSKYDASNYSSFQTNSSGDLTITPTGENTSVVGDMSVNGTLTLNPGAQAYKIGNRGSTLYFQSQTNDTSSTLELFSKRGDGGDSVGLTLWGYGAPDSVDDRHRMLNEYYASGNYYRSYIDHAGTQTAKEYRLYTNDHSEQLVLKPDGSVSMSGALDVGGGINASESAFSVKEATGHGVTSFLDTNTYIKIDHDSTVGKIKGINSGVGISGISIEGASDNTNGNAIGSSSPVSFNAYAYSGTTLSAVPDSHAAYRFHNNGSGPSGDVLVTIWGDGALSASSMSASSGTFTSIETSIISNGTLSDFVRRHTDYGMDAIASIELDDDETVYLHTLFSNADMSGYIEIVRNTPTLPAAARFYLAGRNNSVTKLEDVNTSFDTADTDGKLCLVSAGSNQYYFKNRLGVSGQFQFRYLGWKN